MNERSKTWGLVWFSMVAVWCYALTSSGDEPKPEEPVAAASLDPLIQRAEVKFATEIARAEELLAKTKREASEARLKVYRDRQVTATKEGNLERALAIKSAIEELEKSAPGLQPRPKNVVKFEGHSYALIKDSATWHVAKRRCEAMDGHLVSLESPAEDQFIRKLCGTMTVWAGATDEESEGRWTWCYKNSPVKLAIMIDNAGDADHHLALFKGVWHDGHAGNRYPFVCEWEN